MAQWQALTTLCRQNERVQERVNELYRRINFPYKFRSHFAPWIEDQDWMSVDVNSDAGRKKAENLFKELMMKVQEVLDSLRASQSYDLVKTLDFQQACQNFRQRFEGNYGALVNVISNCLREERTLIDSCETENNDLRRKNRQLELNPQHAIAMEISQSLTNLQQEIVMAEGRLQDVASKQREFILKHNELTESMAKLDRQLLPSTTPPPTASLRKEIEDMKKKMEVTRTQRIFENFTQRTQIAETHITLACKLATELKRVWAEVEKWQDEQKKSIAALSNPSEGSLDCLDRMFDEGGRLLVQMVQQVTKAIEISNEIRYNQDEKLEKLKIVHNELCSDYLVQHLHSAFVIDRHNDRVLKVGGGKSLGFSMSVRILGGAGLGLEFNQPTVKLSLFDEHDIPDSSDHADGVCQIYNGGDRKFTVNRGTGACVAQFNSIQLKNVRRPDRGKNEELVTERKYAFVFYTTVTVCQQQIPLKVISLPVILTSQTSQEIMARGTLIWDAAFSEQDRKPFVYKDTVTWAEVAAVLNALFMQNTERGLNKEQLNYLARMAFRARKDEDFDAKLITEKQVIRERLPNRDFSFWKWFWANMNLVKDKVKTEWKDGLIYGFIAKDDAKRKLCDAPCGTFLLRFSETNVENSQKSDICGFLTLAVMEMDPHTGQKKLFHVKEYLSPKDLAERGLAPILDAMEVADYTKPGTKKRLLRYVWPDTNTQFETRFTPYIKQREDVDDGYNRGQFTIEIFLTDDQSRRHRQDSVDSEMLSCPSTPYTGAASPQSSVMSPGTNSYYDPDLTNDYGIAGIDLHQMIPLQAPQRQMAAVRPQVQVVGDAVNGVTGINFSQQNPPIQPQPQYNPFTFDTYEDQSFNMNAIDLAAIEQLLSDNMQDADLHLGLDSENDIIVQSNHR